jgi:DNA adenine methylase
MTVVEQLPLFDALPPAGRVVNVASVRQLSPFRYPGGKTWFIPHLKQWLAARPHRPTEFLEPFAGGASVSLTVLVENLADHVTLVELDENVISVWQTIFQGDANKLANQIVGFDMNFENVLEVMGSDPVTLEDRAFKTILRNRVNRGGILAPGAGMLKEGENGKGLHSRWYPETLKKRILTLAPFRNRITVVHGDGLTALERIAENEHVAVFLDPPYTVGGKKAGSRLYTHSELDHERLFSIARDARSDFVMTYDNDPAVAQLAQSHCLETRPVAMKNTHHKVMTELFIGRSLDWLR